MSGIIDKKSILEQFEKKDRDRKPTTLYISQKVYRQFQVACGDVAASKVVEKLMKAFIDDEQLKPNRKVEKGSR